MTNVDDFLNGSTSRPLIKLNNPGSKLVFDLIEARLVQERDFDTGQLVTWDDGKPKKQIVLDVHIDWAASHDISVGKDGQQEPEGSYYVRYTCQLALQQACEAAGVRLSEVGRGAIARTPDGVPKKQGLNPPQQFAAQVQRRIAAAGVDDLLDGQPAAPAAQQGAPTGGLL